MDKTRQQYLLEQYKQGFITPAEKRELWQLIRSTDSEPWLLDEIEKELRAADTLEGPFPAIITESEGHEILANVFAGDIREIAPDRPIHFLRRLGWAAAVAAILLGTGTYFLFRVLSEKGTVKVLQATNVLPGTNKAILTLGDGSSVTLDSTGRQVIRQGTTAIHQQGGQLRYDVNGPATSVSYNTLTTPPGGQFQLQLPDGTQVWLNAASSIRYPTAFASNERLVKVTGEVYFEVAAGAQTPFKVNVNGKELIQVLGTRFNVNAYANEESLQTTLLQGSVRVLSISNNQPVENSAVTLKPGMQAQVTDHITLTRADLDKVMAWKNGYFSLEGVRLDELMRQVERWYGVEVVYEKGIPAKRFFGEISRNMTLKDFMESLQDWGVHFRMENRRLIILP